MGQLKRELARAIIERFHGADEAVAAEQRFDVMFKAGGVPDDAPSVSLTDIAVNDSGKVFLPSLLTSHLGVASGGEARRLLSQGGVKLDGDVLPGGELEIDPALLAGKVVQVGKRKFLRIT
jgi:tyrosyl-tRNA synthetase